LGIGHWALGIGEDYFLIFLIYLISPSKVAGLPLASYHENDYHNSQSIKLQCHFRPPFLQKSTWRLLVLGLML
jgi:hypothetical protein